MADAIMNQEVFKVFGFWSSVLVVKMLGMSLLTSRQRMRKQIFANPEDAKMNKKAKVAFDDPDVERVRRAHLNDLENIVPWFLVTWVWLGTGPSTWLATTLIRGFVLARVAHSFVYAIVPIPQPARALAFFVGYAITGYMAITSLMHYW